MSYPASFYWRNLNPPTKIENRYGNSFQGMSPATHSTSSGGPRAQIQTCQGHFILSHRATELLRNDGTFKEWPSKRFLDPGGLREVGAEPWREVAEPQLCEGWRPQ